MPLLLINVEASDKMIIQMSPEALHQSSVLANSVEKLLPFFDSNDTIPVPKVSGETMKLVAEWCEKHKNDVPSTLPAISQWDKEFINGLDNDEYYSIIKAADYLAIESLLNASCKLLAYRLMGKTTEEMRQVLGIAKNGKVKYERMKLDSDLPFDLINFND